MALVGVLCCARSATAQEVPSSQQVALEGMQPIGEPTTTPTTPAAAPSAPARDGSDPFEDPHKGYFFLGAFYRHFVVGTYMLNYFVDGGKVIDEPGGGLQFTYRRDGLSISGQVWGQSAAFSSVFREAGQGANETEAWTSNWGVIWAAASFMWSTSFNDQLALEYGFDVGIGIVVGNAYRTEAYNSRPPTSGPDTNYGDYRPCAYGIHEGSPTMPTAGFPPPPADTTGHSDGFGPYAMINTGPQPADASNPGAVANAAANCGGQSRSDGVRGEQYGQPLHNWSSGGQVPIILPWIGVPHIALRYKPVKQLEIRIDAGAFAGIVAFYLGGSLAYGF